MNIKAVAVITVGILIIIGIRLPIVVHATIPDMIETMIDIADTQEKETMTEINIKREVATIHAHEQEVQKKKKAMISVSSMKKEEGQESNQGQIVR